MSKLPKIKLPRLGSSKPDLSGSNLPESPSFLQPYLPPRTDATRSGSDLCPYCGGYHRYDWEFRECANTHAPADLTYRCSCCGRVYNTLADANYCCEAKKRFERKYDSGASDYDYGYGYATDAVEDSISDSSSSWVDAYANFGQSTTTSASSTSSGGGFFDQFFNFGSSSEESEQSSGGSGGVLSWLFDAGSKK